MGERLLTMRGVSERTGRPLTTLRAWRRTWLPERPTDERQGPEPLVIEGRIQYAESTVDAWITASIEKASTR